MADDHDEANDFLRQLEIFPALSFWYGLSFHELCRMPNWALIMYAEQLPYLLATMELIWMRAAAFPYMKKGAQQQTVSEIRARIRRRIGHAQPVPRERYEETLSSIGIEYAKV